jgi:hypothetical protein
MTKRKKRSLKQQWQAERKWHVSGSLESIASQLIQMASYKSTLHEEKQKLIEIAIDVRLEASLIKRKDRNNRSFTQFKERKCHL